MRSGCQARHTWRSAMPQWAPLPSLPRSASYLSGYAACERYPMVSANVSAPFSRQALAVRILMTLLIVALAAITGFSRTGYDVSTLNPFMWWVLLGIVIIQMRVYPNWTDALCVCTAGAVLSYFAFGYRGLDPTLSAVCCYLGLASWTVLGLRAIWASPQIQARVGFFPAFVACCFFVGFLYVAAPVLYHAEQMQPVTLDLYLVSFDGSLGFQPSFLMGRYYAGLPWLRFLGLLAYSGLPLALALAYVENLRANRQRSIAVGLGIFYLGFIGILAYNLFPGTGPVHVFGPLFPNHPLAMDQARTLPLSPIPVKGSRNAIPSLHMAWILWCWWWAYQLKPWAKAILAGFLVFTVVATLGTGEHYFIDLVVAFPFTLMVLGAFGLALGWRSPERLMALFGGLAATLLWLLLLRYAQPFFWLSPAVPWTLVVATIALVYWLKSRLLHALDARTAAAAHTPLPQHPALGITPSSAAG
jgi:hypothetical protein